jgi:hypothetical protein
MAEGNLVLLLHHLEGECGVPSFVLDLPLYLLRGAPAHHE